MRRLRDSWAADRAREPSSQAGMAAIVAALSSLAPPHWQPVLHGVVIALGGLAVAMKERGRG